ncbi:MAG: hypothetical protein ACRENU_00445, partial [Gemmatimonadaceae bacterium]
KYQPGATIPSGNTEFQFHVAGLKFKSTSYEWLVVAGSKGQFKGEGELNGVAGYSFMLTAIDGKDQGEPDRFRIKIQAPHGGIVYDNALGNDDAATALGGGNISVKR